MHLSSNDSQESEASLEAPDLLRMMRDDAQPLSSSGPQYHSRAVKRYLLDPLEFLKAVRFCCQKCE